MKKLLIILGFLLTVFDLEAPTNSQGIFLPEIVIPVKSYDQEIFDTALELGADTLMAKIVVAQARLESGNFTNRLTEIHNNVFSMQHPRRRRTTSLGAFASAEGRHNKYASYGSVRDSVIDLFFYFKAKKISFRQPSIRSYVQLLKKKSFFEVTAKKYERELKQNFKKITV
jgi:uncharacterized FlgJ-related protein